MIMLGTNDLKTLHRSSSDQIVGGLAGLLAIARSEPYQLRHGGFEILLVCPPPVLEQGIYRDTLMGAHAKSIELTIQIATLADHWGIPFLNAGAHISSSQTDGIHFDADDHVILGKAMAARIAAL